jgi:uncharacterized membrane protein YhaH (DUF805 family)
MIADASPGRRGARRPITRPPAEEESAVSFTEAVAQAFSKYFVFGGRASRPAYWWFALFQILATLAASVIDVALDTYVTYLIVAVVLFIPGLSVLVRRLHDAGHSGWWVLILFLPLIGLIVMLVFTLQASDAPNQWGAGPDPAGGAPAATPPTSGPWATG